MAIQGGLEAVGEHDLWRLGESVNCQCCQHCQHCQNCQVWKIVKIVKRDKIANIVKFVQIIKIVNRSRESVCFKPSPRHDHWRPGRRHHQQPSQSSQQTTVTIFTHHFNHPSFSLRSFQWHLRRKMPWATQTAPRFITKEKKHWKIREHWSIRFNTDRSHLWGILPGGAAMMGGRWSARGSPFWTWSKKMMTIKMMMMMMIG